MTEEYVVERNLEMMASMVPLLPFDVFTAASIGDCQVISEMIKQDINCVRRCNIDGWSALMYSAHHGHLGVVDLLHSHGANLHTKNSSGETALMLATKCGQIAVVQSLVKNGSLLEVRDNKGWTAVFHAVYSHQCQVLQLLLNSGANANACDRVKGDTPLLLACCTADVELVEMLLDARADPCVPDYRNTTPLALATEKNATSIVNVLQKAIKQREQGRDGACTLSSLLADAGLVSYEALFQEQAVNLQEFLTLTDADLKECGVCKMGPRRKMTALIARWHSNAPLPGRVSSSASAEHIFANKLHVEMQEATAKLAKLTKENKKLHDKLQEERTLQLKTESLVVEARGRLRRCHDHSVTVKQKLLHLFSSVLEAADYDQNVPPLVAHGRTIYSDSCTENDGNNNVDKFSGYNLNGICENADKMDNNTNEINEGINNTTAINPAAGCFDNTPIVEDPPSVSLKNSSSIHFKGQQLSNFNFWKHVNKIQNNSYLSNVDNVNGFITINNGFIMPDIAFPPPNIAETDNQDVYRDLENFDLNNTCLPKDYRYRSPRLHVPKLGQPLKECIEIAQTLIGLSDPNVPQTPCVYDSNSTDVTRSNYTENVRSNCLNSNTNYDDSSTICNETLNTNTESELFSNQSKTTDVSRMPKSNSTQIPKLLDQFQLVDPLSNILQISTAPEAVVLPQKSNKPGVNPVSSTAHVKCAPQFVIPTQTSKQTQRLSPPLEHCNDNKKLCTNIIIFDKPGINKLHSNTPNVCDINNLNANHYVQELQIPSESEICLVQRLQNVSLLSTEKTNRSYVKPVNYNIG